LAHLLLFVIYMFQSGRYYRVTKWVDFFCFLFDIHTVFPHIVSAETILFFWIWKSQSSQYIRPTVTVDKLKCAKTVQGRKPYEEIW
jgi:hypothetical protein